MNHLASTQTMANAHCYTGHTRTCDDLPVS